MANVVAKVHATGNQQILLTERGTTFGYNNLVVDMRSLHLMRQHGLIVFDATHSVQRPGASREGFTPGDGHLAPALAKAAVAAGCDGIFMETHPNPNEALSDGPNAVPLNQMSELLEALKEIDNLVKSKGIFK